MKNDEEYFETAPSPLFIGKKGGSCRLEAS